MGYVNRQVCNMYMNIAAHRPVYDKIINLRNINSDSESYKLAVV